MFAGGRIGGNSVCESRLQVKGRGFVYRSINEKWESYVSVGGGGGGGHMRHVDYKTISLIISPIISSELIVRTIGLIVRTIRLIVRTISPLWDQGG